jgi:hypothetical protein
MIKQTKKKPPNSKLDLLNVLTKWLIGKEILIDPVLNDINPNSYKYKLGKNIPVKAYKKIFMNLFFRIL